MDASGDGGDLSKEVDSSGNNIILLLNDLLSRCQTKWYPFHRAIIDDNSKACITFLSFDKVSELPRYPYPPPSPPYLCQK